MCMNLSELLGRKSRLLEEALRGPIHGSKGRAERRRHPGDEAAIEGLESGTQNAGVEPRQE